MRRLVSLAVSLGILALIYARIDLASLAEALATCDLGWLAAGVGMFVPIVGATAWRFLRLAPAEAGMGFGLSTRLILAAGAMNMVLPSKMGDIAKAFFLAKKGGMAASAALSLVVFEKASDLMALMGWCLVGLVLARGAVPGAEALALTLLLMLSGGTAMLFSRRFAALLFGAASRTPVQKIGAFAATMGASWRAMQDTLRAGRAGVPRLVGFSLLLWLMHLAQIWCFIRALGGAVPFAVNTALTPLAIFAGLVPLTFAGIGTRDAALVFFYQAFMSPAQAAALGILCTGRYLVPALAGLPFFQGFLSAYRLARKEGREGQEGRDKA